MSRWIIFVAVVIAAAAVWFAVARRRSVSPPADDDLGSGVDVSFAHPGRAVVTVPGDADPDSPAVTRLVDDVGRSILDGRDDVEEVEFRNRDGGFLGSYRRPTEPPVDVDLTEPRPERRRPAAPALGLRQPDPLEAGARLEPTARRPLADRVGVPPELARGLSDPDDPVELVEALLRRGGHDPKREGDTLIVDAQALVVLRVPVGSTVDDDDLNRAYVRYLQSRARRGVVIAPGTFSVRAVSRRQAMDPTLRHAGLDAIERMVDAATAGVDPLPFVAPEWGTAKRSHTRRR